MKESQIEKAICDYAESCSCLVYKFTSPGRRSVPDRLFVTPNGVVAFLEIKKPGGAIHPKQARTCANLRDRGVSVGIVDNVLEGQQFIDAILNA